ncbi:MAG: hypothetical protein ACM336_09450 [Acidobacteriota bacterium]
MLNYLTKLYELGALPVVRPGAASRMAVGASPTVSGGLGTTVVRLVATTDCHVCFGADPVADENSLFLPANMPEYFACAPEEKISAVSDAADGMLYIAPAI